MLAAPGMHPVQLDPAPCLQWSCQGREARSGLWEALATGGWPPTARSTLTARDTARRADLPVITASAADTADRVEERELPNFEASALRLGPRRPGRPGPGRLRATNVSTGLDLEELAYSGDLQHFADLSAGTT